MLFDASRDYSTTACWLFEAYGALLDSSATAKALGFKSVAALHQARRCDRLPVTMFKMAGRRGWFARVRDVGAWIDSSAHDATAVIPPEITNEPLASKGR